MIISVNNTKYQVYHRASWDKYDDREGMAKRIKYFAEIDNKAKIYGAKLHLRRTEDNSDCLYLIEQKPEMIHAS